MKLLVGCLALGACGRIGFDAAGDGDAAMDGVNAADDGAVLGCASTCGPTGTSSCCESLGLPGGMVFRSYDVGTDNAHTNQGFPATVSAFRLDKYEVTVARFRQFVNAGGGTQQNPPAAGAGVHAQITGSGWDATWNAMLATDTATLIAAIKCDTTYQTWTDAPGGNENRPMNCINWWEAMAFCISDGGYLPTEAEWNYAAAGGSLARAFPWSAPPSSLAIDDSTYASYYPDGIKRCFGDGVIGCEVSDLVPVGSKPAGDGMWGHSDLAGNVWEWALDWYLSPYPTTSCNDCANLTVTPTRAYRGGSFIEVAMFIRGAYRGTAGYPSDRDRGTGVRCARAP